MSSIYDFEVKTSKGESLSLRAFEGKAVLIVNVASFCGFTPQYAGLESLYKKFKDRGFTILAFPCNQFGAQEPKSDSEIQEFCQLNYGVSFPVMSKIDVNGDNAHPLFKFLKSESSGILGTEAIKWNFTKFLVNRQGQAVKRFAPTTKPESLENEIEALFR